ncbi:MAG: penicillin-binding transpeptidase domain-containing protein, partial [bacterium]|nr:penicillin-binding transpeptidase domain-containing protein [bacterium]
MKSSFLFRSRIVVFLLVLFSGAIVTRLFWVQVVHGDYYGGVADRQYVTPSQDLYERGTIYWKRKDGELISAAAQISGFKLAVNTTKLTDAAGVYQKINAIVPIAREEFFTKAAKADDPYEEVALRLSREKADAISALKIPGLSVFKEKWRSYSGESLASHTLGFVGYKGDELGGRYGLERQYDRELSRGKNEPYVNFFAEVFSNIQKSFGEDEKEGDIVTSIEPQVQNFLEDKLREVKERYSADLVGGIIMDPRDGSMYALGAVPDFDPNKFSAAKNNLIFSNPLVENVLEFGSVVKPLIMAGALDMGVVTAKTAYNDTGSVKVEKKEIFNFDKKGRGPGTT